MFRNILANFAALLRPAPGASGAGAQPTQLAPPATISAGIPDEVLALSKQLEGLRLSPYLCDGKKWTIGYGSTRDLQGNPVTASTRSITVEQARAMAERDLARAEEDLRRDFPAGLPPRWWAVGLLMNNNLGRMAHWGATLLRPLQARDWPVAAEQMKAYRLADGRPSTGLRRRRWCEAAYALGMDPAAAHKRAWNEIHTPDDWPPLPPPTPAAGVPTHAIGDPAR